MSKLRVTDPKQDANEFPAVFIELEMTGLGVQNGPHQLSLGSVESCIQQPHAPDVPRTSSITTSILTRGSALAHRVIVTVPVRTTMPDTREDP